MTDPVPSKELIADLNDSRNECHNRGLHGCAGDVQRAIEEIERLRITLTGIQSCSTCEACRGAATLALALALGGDHSWYGGQVNEEACKTLVKLSREAHHAHEPPAAPKRMRIAFQPLGRCLWHEDCPKSRSGIMCEVQQDESRSLLECLSCGQRGYYPKGAVGSVCVDVVESAQPPGDG